MGRREYLLTGRIQNFGKINVLLRIAAFKNLNLTGSIFDDFFIKSILYLYFQDFSHFYYLFAFFLCVCVFQIFNYTSY